MACHNAFCWGVRTAFQPTLGEHKKLEPWKHKTFLVGSSPDSPETFTGWDVLAKDDNADFAVLLVWSMHKHLCVPTSFRRLFFLQMQDGLVSSDHPNN